MIVLAETGTEAVIVQEGMWALILGPYGLLVGSIIVIIVLWKKLNKKEADAEKSITELHKARHDDLVAGLKYREHVSEKLLLDNVEDRVTANKMIDAVQSLTTQQEKNDESLQLVREGVQEVKSTLNNRRQH